MELVNVRNEEGWQHEEQDEVAEDEVSSEEAHFGDLAQEFTSWLRERVPTERVPFASPPCYVGGVRAEFSGERKGNDELVDEALNGDNGNHAQQSLDKAKALQENHDFPEDEEHDDCNSVGNGGQHSTELLAAHAEDWTHTTCHAEEANSNTSVDTNGSRVLI